MSTRIPSSSSSRLMLTIGLCFLVALMEGLDLQAAGIAAGGIAQAFALDKMQMGWIFSAGILGLLPGALVGGMLADRYGRKRILIGSVALFGLFSLATAIAWDFPSLVFARLMTGVGLGAALPNLIALTSEAAGPRFRGTAVSLMYCGVPIGAALAATLRGLSNDVYFQVALLTTIGLSSKNAILIVEFAESAVDEGYSLSRAAIRAAQTRLRPIVMTSLAFIAGVMPLAIATGAGANSRIAIGTGIIGGTLTATLLAIFFVPLFFILVKRLFAGKPRRQE